MNLKTLGLEFVRVFTIALLTAAVVIFMRNILARANNDVNWGTAFLFTVLFGIIQTWMKSREIIAKQS
jgi:heme/copper-type cytochrome/quinol oxidase subunit 3